MKDYDKKKESSYLKYWDVNNLYGLAMSQNLPVNDFTWVEDISEFVEEYFLEIDIQYLENLQSYTTERMKLETVEKLVANLHNKTEYVIHIRNLKKALNRGLVLKRIHRVIKFNQKSQLKPYIDMNTDLRKEEKYDFEKKKFLS